MNPTETIAKGQRCDWESECSMRFLYPHQSSSKCLNQTQYPHYGDQPSLFGGVQQQSEEAVTGFEQEFNILDLDSNQQFSFAFLDSFNSSQVGRTEPNALRVIAGLIHQQSHCFCPATQEQLHGMKSVQSVNCSICHEDEGQGVRLNCSHSFHLECISPWLSMHNTCPTCRGHLQSSD